MKIRTILSLLSAAAIIGGALPARACVFDPRDVQRDIDNADSIFIGSVTSIKHLDSVQDSNSPEYRTMFDVDKVLKGHVTGPVGVTQMHDEWAHYVHLNTGKKYLVLTARNQQLGLMINGCSAVMAVDAADVREDEPGPEYKQMMAMTLGEGTLFPPLAPVAGDGARKRLDQEGKDEQDDPGGQPGN